MFTSRFYNTAFWDNLRERHNVGNELHEGELGDNIFITPLEFRDNFAAALAKDNLFRRHATVISTTPSDFGIEAITSTGTAAWVESGTPIPESSDTFTQLALHSNKLAALSRIRTSFIKDTNFDLERYLTEEFARRFGRAEENGFLNGSGENEPYGILHPEQGAQVGVTAASATEITFDEVVKLYFSLAPEYRQNARWIMNDETAFYLRTLKDKDGAYLWRDRDDTIFGKPVEISPYAPGMATGASPIVLADLHYYWVTQRQPLTVRILKERYAQQGQIGLLAYENLDGRLIIPEAGKRLIMADG